MKRTHVVLVGVLTAIATPLAAAAAQGGAPSAAPARVARVQVRKTSLGKILVNASGFTLYEFSKDGHNSDRCAKISGCAAIWPALNTTGKPKAGSGVSASKLSTIALSGGAKQVTYAGHPLYIYSGDSAPGDTSYVGAMQFGGSWHAINAAGKAVG